MKRLKKDRPRGEASLRGHLKGDDGKERSGSSAYVPRDKAKDKQLKYALNFIRGIKAENTPAKEPVAKN